MAFPQDTALEKILLHHPTTGVCGELIVVGRSTTSWRLYFSFPSHGVHKCVLCVWVLYLLAFKLYMQFPLHISTCGGGILPPQSSILFPIWHCFYTFLSGKAGNKVPSVLVSFCYQHVSHLWYLACILWYIYDNTDTTINPVCSFPGLQGFYVELILVICLVFTCFCSVLYSHRMGPCMLWLLWRFVPGFKLVLAQALAHPNQAFLDMCPVSKWFLTVSGRLLGHPSTKHCVLPF